MVVARASGASRVVLAVPVAPPGWEEGVHDVADELVCIETPDPFVAVGSSYADFTQTTDEEIASCLHHVRLGQPADEVVAAPIPVLLANRAAQEVASTSCLP